MGEFLLANAGDSHQLAKRVTPEGLKKGGVATELFAWVTLLGAIGKIKASYVDYVWAKKWAPGAGFWHIRCCEKTTAMGFRRAIQ